MKNGIRKEIQAILALLGILVFICTYFLGYLKVKDLTSAMEAENRTLKATAEAYEILYTSEATYKTSKAEDLDYITGYENGYATSISTQDEIMYVDNMERNVAGNLTVSYINMSTPSVSEYTPELQYNAAFTTGIIERPQIADDGIAFVTYPVDFGCNISYEGFKSMINYLNTVGTKKNLSSVSLSFDSSTGILNGVIGMEMYALSGTGKNYSPLTIPGVSVGVENIFGTVEEQTIYEFLPSDDEAENPQNN